MNEDFTAYGLSEGGHLDLENALPSTPLTNPSSPTTVQKSRRKLHGYKSRRKLARWRIYFSSVQNSLSFTSSCPFVCSDCTRTDRHRHASTDLSVNNLGAEFSKLNNPKGCNAPYSIPIEHKIGETLNDEATISNAVSFHSPMRFKLNNCNLTSTKNTNLF